MSKLRLTPSEEALVFALRALIIESIPQDSGEGQAADAAAADEDEEPDLGDESEGDGLDELDEKPTKGKKPKDDEEEESEEAEEEESEEEGEPEDKGPSQDDVREALKKLIKAQGRSKAEEVLKRFGASSLPLLKKKFYSMAIKLCDKLADA
jgi:hypothetical protein